MNNNFSEEDIKKVAKGTGTTLIGGIAGGGFNFLSQIMIARFLGVEAFGLYALGFAAVKICEIFAKLGLNSGGMRFVSIYKDDSKSKLKGVLISSTGISLLNGVLLGTILYFLSDFFAQKIFHKPELTESLRLFAMSIPFISGISVVSSLLLGFQNTKYNVYINNFFQPLTNITLIICFYYYGFRLSGVIYSFILSHIISFIIAIFYLNKLSPEIKNLDIKPIFEIKSLISYSIPLLFLGFINYFLSWTDTLMLGFLSTTTDVGIYRAASRVPFIMTLFLGATNSLYAPLVADLYNKGEMQRLANIYKSTTRWVTYAVVPVFVFILFSPKEIMMVFGKEYIETGYIVLIIFSFGQLISCIVGGAGYTLIMTGRQNIQLLISVASVVMNVALNIILIPRYGSIGAAIATSISIAFANITKVILVFSYIKAHPFNAHFFKFASFSIIAVIALLILNNYFLSFPKFSFGIKAFEVLLIFSVFFYFVKLEAEDKFIFDKIRSKLSV
jgi:O-antigen/teichoic acid export membrane protein